MRGYRIRSEFGGSRLRPTSDTSGRMSRTLIYIIAQHYWSRFLMLSNMRTRVKSQRVVYEPVRLGVLASTC
jgi:hypothetical protein